MWAQYSYAAIKKFYWFIANFVSIFIFLFMHKKLILKYRSDLHKIIVTQVLIHQCLKFNYDSSLCFSYVITDRTAIVRPVQFKIRCEIINSHARMHDILHLKKQLP